MKSSVSTLKQENDRELLSPEQAFEWPRQSEKDQNWSVAAKRWAILRKVYPDNPDTWLQGANAYIKADKPQQANVLLEHARQHFHNHLDTLLLSAEYSIHIRDWKSAGFYLKQARETFPDSMQTWLKSSEYAERQGDLKLATEYNEKARLLFPDNSTPFVQYAELAMRSEQWEQALERWEIVRSRFPDLDAGYRSAAIAASRLNRQQEARKLKLAYQYGPEILNETSIESNRTKTTHHGGISQLLDLIWTKAIFDLRSEVSHNFLLYGWWIIEPLLHMAAFYVVFGLMLNRGGENYPVFLLTGLVPWMWFTKAVSGSSNSIIAGQNLMLQVGLPSISFPLIKILQLTIKQGPAFILLLGFVWVLASPPSNQWWALIPVILTQALITISFACIVAAVVPFIRDLSYIVPTGLTLLMFLSGIFYDYRTISPEWQELFLLNPMAFILKCYREIFIDNILPDLYTLTIWGLGSVVTCIAVLLTYKRLRYIYPRIVQQ